MKKILAIFACVALVTGCSADQPPPAQFVAPPSAKIVLNVAHIDIVDHGEFQPSDSPYYTDHLAPTIAQAAHKWIENTLQAGGSSGQAIVTIEDASLSARALPTSDSWFKREQASRYNGHISVHVDLRSGMNYGYADAEATHYATLPEQPTAGERQSAYAGLLDGLMGDFGKNFDASIREHAQWAVIPSP